MARIRTVKPEFFQSQSMASCTPHSRLLAIALLQLCDNQGVFLNIPMQVHAHAFPWEAEVKIDALLGELESIGFVKLYSVKGKRYGLIHNFNKHQRLSGKEVQSGGIYPLPEAAFEGKEHEKQEHTDGEAEGKQRGSNSEAEGKRMDAQEQGTGKEEQGNREQGTGKDSLPASSSPAKPKTGACPHQQIIELYHEILPTLRGVKLWTDKREKHLQARWREDPTRQNLDWWREYFRIVAASDFLMGQNDRGFTADLEWLVNQANMTKVLEGKYHTRASPQGAAPSATFNQNKANIQAWLDMKKQQREREVSDCD